MWTRDILKIDLYKFFSTHHVAPSCPHITISWVNSTTTHKHVKNYSCKSNCTFHGISLLIKKYSSENEKRSLCEFVVVKNIQSDDMTCLGSSHWMWCNVWLNEKKSFFVIFLCSWWKEAEEVGKKNLKSVLLSATFEEKTSKKRSTRKTWNEMTTKTWFKPEYNL